MDCSPKRVVQGYTLGPKICCDTHGKLPVSVTIQAIFNNLVMTRME